MNGRRFACFFLGAWLAASAMISLVTSQNKRSIDRVMMNLSPAMAAQVKTLGPVHARLLLRDHVSEQNRWYMRTWGNTQIFVGGLLVFFLLFGTREGRVSLVLSVAIFAVVIAQRLVLLPELASLGRLVELLGVDASQAERNKLWVVESAYYSLEILKGLVGLALAGKLIFQTRERLRHSGKQIDVVNEADHRHVNW
jgi:hypothetical protein